MSVSHFRAKHLLLTHLLHRGIRLISIIHHHCPELDYIGISNMENILCNIYLILSEVLYDQFGVRNTPIEELGLPARCITSTRDFCCADMELIKILMLILLDFSNVSLSLLELPSLDYSTHIGPLLILLFFLHPNSLWMDKRLY